MIIEANWTAAVALALGAIACALGARMDRRRRREIELDHKSARAELFERDVIVDALKRTNGNMAAAARDLDTTGRILRYKVKQLDIDPKRYRRSGQR